MPMPYCVYVLRNPQGRLYIGLTADLETRVAQHKSGEAGWTHSRGPWELVRYETYATQADAMRRERSLKPGRANLELRRRFNQPQR